MEKDSPSGDAASTILEVILVVFRIQLKIVEFFPQEIHCWDQYNYNWAFKRNISASSEMMFLLLLIHDEPWLSFCSVDVELSSWTSLTCCSWAAYWCLGVKDTGTHQLWFDLPHNWNWNIQNIFLFFFLLIMLDPIIFFVFCYCLSKTAIR